jgi:hypothetical protein
MLLGGGCTLILQVTGVNLPLGLDPNAFGISAAALGFLATDRLNY